LTERWWLGHRNAFDRLDFSLSFLSLTRRPFLFFPFLFFSFELENWKVWPPCAWEIERN
jgi:hypothetical protein